MVFSKRYRERIENILKSIDDSTPQDLGLKKFKNLEKIFGDKPGFRNLASNKLNKMIETIEPMSLSNFK